MASAPEIATFTFRERNRRILLETEFPRGVVEPIDIGDVAKVRYACQKAGDYLKQFRTTVRGRRGPDSARLLFNAFNNLLNAGTQLALRLTDGDADLLVPLQDAFRRSWPSWRWPTQQSIPTVQLVGSEEAVAFPLELLPMFDFGNNIPVLENATVVEEVASRFLGFTAVVCRMVPGANRNHEVLHNVPTLQVQFMRYLDSKRWSLWRRSSKTSFQQEEDFLARLRKRGFVSLDGPWPSGRVARRDLLGLVEALLDALYDPTRYLAPSMGAEQPNQLSHLACHCQTEGRDAEDYELELSSKVRVRLRDIAFGYAQRAVRDGSPPSSRARPPVILNACGTSTVDPWSQLSFQHHFLKNHHRAFLGTQASIDGNDAAAYSDRLYRFLLAGFTLGQAVVLARRQLLAETGSPLGLLYVQCGNDQFVVDKAYPPEELGVGGTAVAQWN